MSANGALIFVVLGSGHDDRGVRLTGISAAPTAGAAS